MRMSRASTLIATTAALGLSLTGSAALAQEQAATPEASGDALTGVVWNVEAVGPAPPLKDQTATFQPGGGLRIDTGCAAYTSSYAVEGEALSIDTFRREFGSIEDCSFGEMGSADNYRNTLEAAERWAIDDGRLVIEAGGERYAGNTITFAPGEPAEEAGTDGTAAAVDAEELAGTWGLTFIRPLPGEEVLVPEDIGITLELDAEGAVSGTGPCGAYEGTYTLAGGDSITIAGVAGDESQTCEGAPADFHALYLAILPVVDTAAVEADVLTLGASMLGAELEFEGQQ